MFPNQNKLQLSNAVNILQGQSLRVAAAPHQQPLPIAQGSNTQQAQPRPIQALGYDSQNAPGINQGGWGQAAQPGGNSRIQTGGFFNQQRPQRGVTSWSLRYLADPNPAYPAYDTVINNVSMHVPAYSGSGWPSVPTVNALSQPNFPVFQKLPYQ